MAEREGNIIQRGIVKGVDATKPIEVVAIGGGIILGSGALVAGGIIGLVGGEIVKEIVKPKSK